MSGQGETRARVERLLYIVVVDPPGLDSPARLRKLREPVLIEILGTNVAVERFGDGIVRRFSRPPVRIYQQNTPTGLIAYELGRIEDAMRSHASETDRSLKPVNVNRTR